MTSCCGPTRTGIAPAGSGRTSLPDEVAPRVAERILA
jgi:hypothetical protein